MITDNKKFWKNVKPCFSEKAPTNKSITLLEKNVIVTEHVKCAEIFNNYFIDAVASLDIDRDLNADRNLSIEDSVDKYIDMYKNHPSIRKINLKGFLKNSFSFNHVSARNISEIISNLDSSNAYQKDNIPPKILKENNEFSSVVLAYDINRCIDVGIFPPNLKNSDVTPTFKKDDRLLKENYRPISILPTLSKVY